MTKPLPIPPLIGKSARQFIEQIKKPLTKKQKAILAEATRVSETINFNSQEKEIDEILEHFHEAIEGNE